MAGQDISPVTGQPYSVSLPEDGKDFTAALGGGWQQGSSMASQLTVGDTRSASQSQELESASQEKEKSSGFGFSL